MQMATMNKARSKFSHSPQRRPPPSAARLEYMLRHISGKEKVEAGAAVQAPGRGRAGAEAGIKRRVRREVGVEREKEAAAESAIAAVPKVRIALGGTNNAGAPCK